MNMFKTAAVVAVLAVGGLVASTTHASGSTAPKASKAHIVGTWPNDVSESGSGGYAIWNNGRVQALGHAPFYGSVKKATSDIVGFAADEVSGGYWLIGANGAVFSLGTTCQFETLVAPKNRPSSGVVGAISLSSDLNEGFNMVTKSGHLYAFTCQFTDG
jgi:hypothetical protein